MTTKKTAVCTECNILPSVRWERFHISHQHNTVGTRSHSHSSYWSWLGIGMNQFTNQNKLGLFMVHEKEVRALSKKKNCPQTSLLVCAATLALCHSYRARRGEWGSSLDSSPLLPQVHHHCRTPQVKRGFKELPFPSERMLLLRSTSGKRGNSLKGSLSFFQVHWHCRAPERER